MRIEPFEFAFGASGFHRAAPAAVDKRWDVKQREQSAGHKQNELRGIGPHNGFQSAHISVHQRKADKEQDGRQHGPIEHQLQGDAGDKHAHAGGQRADDEKHYGRRLVRAAAEGVADERVGRVDFFFEIQRHHHHRQHDAANHVADHDLDEHQITAIRHRGHADESQRAGLGGHDGKRHRPPRQLASAEKIIARGFLAAPQPNAQRDDADEVNNDDRPIN